jgi:hypothetical protein
MNDHCFARSSPNAVTIDIVTVSQLPWPLEKSKVVDEGSVETHKSRQRARVESTPEETHEELMEFSTIS